MNTPLSEQLRPVSLATYVGQDKAVDLLQTLLKRHADSPHFPSLIFWGPPGCGKTTLARILAKELKRDWHEFSAVHTSVKDIEKLVTFEQLPAHIAQFQLIQTLAPFIFIDEIHRYNKAQQDVLLPLVEQGKIILCAATTENPSFSVIPALRSRARVVVLEAHSLDSLNAVLEHAKAYLEFSMEEKAQKLLIGAANGDARILLNLLDAVSTGEEKQHISQTDISQLLQSSSLYTDKWGDELYNTISAFQKSIRGSDPDASLYWLARLLESGQDPLYAGRRLLRIASEDIGLADPQALPIAVAAYTVCEKIGLPECKLALAEATVYLAKAAKSNSLETGYAAAKADVEEYANLSIPLHLRNAPTQLMKDLDYGADYKYEHSKEGLKNPSISFLPDEIKGHSYL